MTVGARTYFVVSKINGTQIGSYHRLIIQNSSPYYNLLSQSGNASYYVNGFYNSSTPYSGTQLHTLIHSTSAFFYRINQTQILTSAVGASNLTATFGIGGYPNPDGLNGELPEVLVYNRALTDAEVQSIESYLRGKYNLW